MRYLAPSAALLIAAIIPVFSLPAYAKDPPLFISPMGEPFRPSSDSPQRPFMTWFSGADTNDDGKLDGAEFRSDASRFFTMLDVDGDKEIGPVEMTRYEEEIVPEIRTPMLGRSGGGMPRAGMGQRPGGMGRGGGGMGGMGGGSMGAMGGGDIARRIEEATKRYASRPQGLELFGLLAIPHPVASADVNMDRGVSEQEFLRASQERFSYLDQNQDGGFVPEEAIQVIKSRKSR